MATGGADLVVKVGANITALQADMAAAAASIKTIETTATTASAGATSAFNGLQRAATDLAAGFLAMFTARAVFNFVEKTVQEASALKDLSQQTHINVEELQLLAGGMSEFGVDADTLGKGLYRLSRGIAGSDESVAHGLHLMGMSLKDVEGLNGKELFLKIEGGLATLQGGLRDSAAADLFGSKLGAAMAGASEGIEGALDTWARLNHVASTESVDAMDAFGESITRANKNLSAIAANMIGPLAQGFNVLNDTADKGASKWAIAWAMLKDFGDNIVSMAPKASHLATLLDHLTLETTKGAAANTAFVGPINQVAAALTAQGQAAKFMAALQADAAVKLEAGQIKNLEHLKEIGALNAKNAEGIGVSGAQFAKYTADVAAAAKATEALKKATEERAKLEAGQVAATTQLWDKYYATVNAASHDTTKAQIDNVWLAADAQIAAMEKAKTITVEGYAIIWQTAQQTADNIIAKTLEEDGHSKAHYEKLADEARIAYDFAIQYSDQYTDREIANRRRLKAEAEENARSWRKVDDAAQGAGASTQFSAAETEIMTIKMGAAQGEADNWVTKLHQLQAAADAVTAANRAMGGSFPVETLTGDDLQTQYGGKKGAIARLKQIEAMYQSAPGRKAGGSGSTGLAASDAVGWVAMLAEQREYAALKKALPGYERGVTNAPGGWAMVGERGPEAMYVPQGADIHPNGSGGAGSVAAILAAMKPDEIAALVKGYQQAMSAGFQGSLQAFLQQQLSFYQTLKEGDARLKTWFYGETVSAFKVLNDHAKTPPPPVNITVHVTQPFGTPDAIARAVGDAITKSMKQARQWPAA